MLNNPTVSVYSDPLITYPEIPPFSPDEDFPEYSFLDRSLLSPVNKVYKSVRESLFLLGLDSDNFNSEKWNPLGLLATPGQTVLIKPNAVMHLNMNSKESVFASITHGSVLRVIVDYVYTALKGNGRIIIADAPLAYSDFEE